MKFEVFRDKRVEGREWYWRIRSTGNGEVIGGSTGEGYVRRIDALQTIDLIRREAKDAEVVLLDDDLPTGQLAEGEE